MLYLHNNNLSQIPVEILKLNKLETLLLDDNPMTIPPSSIIEQGIPAISDYFKQLMLQRLLESLLILIKVEQDKKK